MDITQQLLFKVIKLASLPLDWKDFATHLASMNPKFFVESVTAYTEAMTVSNDSWIAKAHAEAAAGQSRVSVIKYVEEHGNIPMKDAKEWVDTNIIFTQ